MTAARNAEICLDRSSELSGYDVTLRATAAALVATALLGASDAQAESRYPGQRPVGAPELLDIRDRAVRFWEHRIGPHAFAHCPGGVGFDVADDLTGGDTRQGHLVLGRGSACRIILRGRELGIALSYLRRPPRRHVWRARSSVVDVYATAVHEAGHVAGLAHTSGGVMSAEILVVPGEAFAYARRRIPRRPR